MPQSPPTFLHSIRPAALCTLLVFLLFFLLPWAISLRGDRPVDFMLLPVWVAPLAMLVFCILAIGLPVAFFTGYAQGRQQRIDRMLDSK